jgi:hypothetical protein
MGDKKQPGTFCEFLRQAVGKFFAPRKNFFFTNF